MRILQLWNKSEDRMDILTAIESSNLKEEINLNTEKITKITVMTNSFLSDMFNDIRELINATEFLANYKKNENKGRTTEETFVFVVE